MSRGGSYNAVYNALFVRIGNSRLDLFKTYGIENVIRAIEDKAGRFETFMLDEIGSSDISCWVKDIEKSLSTAEQTARYELNMGNT